MKLLLWAIALAALVYVPGCATHSRTARPEPPALKAPGTVTWNAHAGEVFVFDHPQDWAIQTPAGEDPRLRMVRLHSETGLYGQLTLVRNPPAGEAFAARVIEQLRQDGEGLQAEPFAARLAGIEAQGHRFTFQKKGLAWAGCVLSCRKGDDEICALGRWPVDATDLQEQWSLLVQNLRVKANDEAGRR